MRKHIDLYTDGACSGNPGPGGYGAILVYEGKEKELSGGDPSTTNNRMELLAVIEGLRALREDCDVTLYSDSKYVIDALRLGWAKAWQARGWVKADRKPALNSDLWEELLSLTARHHLEAVWIRGHNQHPYNERCDRLAVAAAEQAKNQK